MSTEQQLEEYYNFLLFHDALDSFYDYCNSLPQWTDRDLVTAHPINSAFNWNAANDRDIWSSLYNNECKLRIQLSVNQILAYIEQRSQQKDTYEFW